LAQIAWLPWQLARAGAIPKMPNEKATMKVNAIFLIDNISIFPALLVDYDGAYRNFRIARTAQ
jgi:hypothetical protein